MYHYYYPVYYPPYYYQPYLPVRQLPQVDSGMFQQSANEMKTLMNDASLVLDELADSKEFNEAVMTAAQESNNEEVERLIQQTGITSKVDVSFNPDNLRLEFVSQIDGSECCRLYVAIRWR